MDIDQLKAEALGAIGATASLDALEAERVRLLGKQGQVTALLKTLGGMSPEQRQSDGPRINGLREAVSTAIAERKAALEGAALEARLASERIDLSLPAPETPRGLPRPPTSRRSRRCGSATSASTAASRRCSRRSAR